MSISTRSARGARWKANLWYRMSSDRPVPALHGCGRTWYILASSIRSPSVRRSIAEHARRPDTADSGVARSCGEQVWMFRFRSWPYPMDQAGARHSLSPVEAETLTVIDAPDATCVVESTHKKRRLDLVFCSRRGTAVCRIIDPSPSNSTRRIGVPTRRDPVSG
jgi:hypothetical protein